MKREAKKTKRERKGKEKLKTSETSEERQRRLEAQRTQAQKHHEAHRAFQKRHGPSPAPELEVRPQGATAYLLGMAAALGGGIAPFFRGCR